MLIVIKKHIGAFSICPHFHLLSTRSSSSVSRCTTNVHMYKIKKEGGQPCPSLKPNAGPHRLTNPNKLQYDGQRTTHRRATWCRNGEKTIVWRCINRLIAAADETGVESPAAIEAQIRKMDAEFMRLTGMVSEDSMDTITDALAAIQGEIQRLKEKKVQLVQE